MKRMVLVALLAAGVLGCMGGRRGGAGGDLGGPGRATELTVKSGGDDRTAWVHTPKGKNLGNLPLVIMVHGGARDGTDRGRSMLHLWESHFDEPVVFAFPNSDFRGKVAWSGPDDPEPLRDLRFLQDLVDEIASKTSIDRDRIYLAGFSAGAAFTWYAHCADAERYRGFAMTGFSLPDVLLPGCAPSTKRPVIYVHGTLDPKVPFDGNEFSKEGAPGTVEWLRTSRRCGAASSEPVKTGTEGVTLRGKVFDGCPSGASVETWRAEGQGHCVGTRDGSCGGYEWSDMVFDFWKRTAGM